MKSPHLYIWQNIIQTTTTASSIVTDFGRHAYCVAIKYRVFTGVMDDYGHNLGVCGNIGVGSYPVEPAR